MLGQRPGPAVACHPRVTPPEGVGEQRAPQFLPRPLGSPRSEQQEKLWARLETRADSSCEWATKGVRATEGLEQTLEMWLSPRQELMLLVVRNSQFRGEQGGGGGPWSPFPVVTPVLSPFSALYQGFLLQPRARGSWMFSKAL